MIKNLIQLFLGFKGASLEETQKKLKDANIDDLDKDDKPFKKELATAIKTLDGKKS